MEGVSRVFFTLSAVTATSSHPDSRILFLYQPRPSHSGVPVTAQRTRAKPVPGDHYPTLDDGDRDYQQFPPVGFSSRFDIHFGQILRFDPLPLPTDSLLYLFVGDVCGVIPSTLCDTICFMSSASSCTLVVSLSSSFYDFMVRHC